MDYVWYVGYGSNINEQRFLCYIYGGSPLFGKKHTRGCTDKIRPPENKQITIGFPLYFALPGAIRRTSNWGYGGVAFIDQQEDKSAKTFCRMWKITKRQYDEVREQESRNLYGKEILLGEDCGIPVYSITSYNIHDNVICPSIAYIKTIAAGLRETYSFSDDAIVNYLLEKKGISGSMQKDKMLRIIQSLCVHIK
jgi:hypothetical protein